MTIFPMPRLTQKAGFGRSAPWTAATEAVVGSSLHAEGLYMGLLCPETPLAALRWIQLRREKQPK